MAMGFQRERNMVVDFGNDQKYEINQRRNNDNTQAILSFKVINNKEYSRLPYNIIQQSENCFYLLR